MFALQESTSHDNDQSTRQRHQSAPDEPQSTTSTPTSKQQTFPPSQRQRHSSVEQSPFNRPLSVGSDSGSYKTTESFKRSTESILADKQLDNFLTSLWEKGNDVNQIQPQKKRKLSSSEVDSTGDQDQTGKEGTKLMRENALLAKLLSTKTKKENIVNTGISGNANPSATPQSRLTKDVTQRLLSVKPNPQQVKDNKSDSVQSTSDLFLLASNKEMGQLKNLNKNSTLNKSSDLLNSFSSTNQVGTEDSTQDNFDTLQMLLSSQAESSMEISEVSESTDPLLNEILQQAEDLKQDLNGPPTPSSSTGTVNNGPSQPENTGMLSDLALLSQFEQVLSEKNASLEEIDQLLGISSKTVPGKPSNDIMAIEEIQKELMRDDPVQPGSTNQMMTRTLQQQVQGINNPRGNFMQSMSPVHGNGNMDLSFPVQQISPPNPQGFQQQQQPPNFGLPGPRLPGPPGEYLVCLLM